MRLLEQSRQTLIGTGLQAQLSKSKEFARAEEKQASIRADLHLTRLRISKKKGGLEARLAAIEAIKAEIFDLENLEREQVKKQEQIAAEIAEIKRKIESRVTEQLDKNSPTSAIHLPAT